MGSGDLESVHKRYKALTRPVEHLGSSGVPNQRSPGESDLFHCGRNQFQDDEISGGCSRLKGGDAN